MGVAQARMTPASGREARGSLRDGLGLHKPGLPGLLKGYAGVLVNGAQSSRVLHGMASVQGL